MPVFVQSGGVSLGSYGAGYTYYFTTARHQYFDELEQKSAPGTPAPKRSFEIMTGASAGSINAVLAAIAMCKRPPTRPSDSIFYRAWIPVGMTPAETSLADPNKATARALFSRKPVDDAAELARGYFEDPSDWRDTACDVILGLVATRKAMRELPLKLDGTGSPPKVTRQTDKFILRFSRAAVTPGQPPPQTEIFNGDFAPAELQDAYPRLGRDGLASPIPFNLVLRLMKASSAFPFAFEPVDLPISTFTYDANKKDRGHWANQPERCSSEENGICRGGPQYYDGAVYENVPLLLSEDIGAWSPPGSRTLPALVLDYDSESFHRKEKPADDDSANLLPTFLQLAGNVFAANMGAEYFRAIENRPKDRQPTNGEGRLLRFTERNLPPASNHFFNFLGFFERDFRIFDFYLGMLDAHRATGWELIAADPSQDEWKIFNCFKDWEAVSSHFKVWPPATLESCRDFVRWSRDEKSGEPKFATDDFDQLEKGLRADKKKWSNLVRLLAAAQKFRMRVERQATKGLMGDTDAWFEAASYFGYAYRDVDGRGDMRDIINKQLRALATEQNGVVQTNLVRLIGQVIANQIEYREPRFILAVGSNAVRGVEAGLGFRVSDWFRPELHLTAQDVYLWKSDARALLGGRLRFVVPLGRLTGKFSSDAFQLEPFTSLSYNWAIGRDPTWQTLGIDAGSYFVLLQRLYLSVAYTKVDLQHNRREWRDLVALNHVMGFFGWRFLW